MVRPDKPKSWYAPDQTGRYVGLVRPRNGYWPDRNVGIGQTKQTECEYWSDQTNQKVGIGQTKQADMWDWSDREMGTGQTEMWVLAKQNRLNVEYWPDQTSQYVGICRTKQTEMWVLATPQRPRCGYWPDQSNRNVGIGRTKETEMLVCPMLVCCEQTELLKRSLNLYCGNQFFKHIIDSKFDMKLSD